MAVAAATGLVGLSVYLYIPFAASLNPPLPYNHPTTPESVWFLVSGEQFRGQFDFLGSKGPGEFVAALPALWDTLVDRGTAVLPVLGVLGLVLLVRRRPAFGLCLVAILLSGLYVWANYLRLEHYLLVPWLILALGAGVTVEWLIRFVETRLPAPSESEPADGTNVGVVLGGVAVIGALVLGMTNLPAADRSRDRSGEDYVTAVFDALPENAAILSEWDASAPLWHGQHVRGLRPDVLIVDDTNIVYEGWGTREARIAALICDRPVFILRLRDSDLAPTSEAYDLSPFLRVKVGAGTPTAVVDRQIERVEPRPETCST